MIRFQSLRVPSSLVDRLIFGSPGRADSRPESLAVKIHYYRDYCLVPLILGQLQVVMSTNRFWFSVMISQHTLSFGQIQLVSCSNRIIEKLLDSAISLNCRQTLLIHDLFDPENFRIRKMVRVSYCATVRPDLADSVGR